MKGDIVAISIAKKDCYEGKNSYREGYEVIGYTVETAYEELAKPINMKGHFDVIKPLLPLKYSAFQDNGDGNQGYLYPCNEMPALLRASHSKPWKDSTDEERLDMYNGLLLCCNHDALYNSGYIAFDGTGKIHISSDINEENYAKYGIHPKMRVNRREENKPYFKWHKRHVFKG